MSKPVYFDYAAATPTDKRVVEVMVNCMSIDGAFANPHAKDHVYGWQAAEAVEYSVGITRYSVGITSTNNSLCTHKNHLTHRGRVALRIRAFIR